MKAWRKIAEIIGMPDGVISELGQRDTDINNHEISESIASLTRPEESMAAWKRLRELLSPDGKGFGMLLCMLSAADITHEEYKARGIKGSIFADTMKCFTRFVREHMASYGEYGFDRDFWTWRQLSLRLFRIGELEYEKCTADDDESKRSISLHIPSDAVISRENCLGSYEASKKFFAKFYPEYTGVPVVCSSWLLSPELKKLLPENSRILQFQQLFDIKSVNKESQSFLEWVYKRKDIPLESLPEDTTLQRNMKRHLLSGGWIGDACGELIC